MSRSSTLLAVGAFAVWAGLVPARAETVMQQCGQQYQAAKAGGTLNGMSWTQFRKDCAAKLKAQPAAAATPAAPATAAEPTVANPLKPDSTAAAPPAAAAAAPAAGGKSKMPATGGRAAMLARERQCGAEWKAQKATLVAQTPGLTWPKYWSQCNTRLKAAGQ